MGGTTMLETYDRIEGEVAARRLSAPRRTDEELRARLAAALGMASLDPPAPPHAKVLGCSLRGGVRIERLVFDLDLPVPAHLYLPEVPRPPYPAVLSIHGHSAEGKSARAYYLLHQMLALRGMAVLAPDLPGLGERKAMDRQDPVGEWSLVGLGQCLHGVIADEARALTGYLASRKEVDDRRIGCTGNGCGGLQAAMLAALDPRMAAAAPSSCFATFAYLSAKERHLCPCCLLPGVPADAEIEDVLSLIAPRPLLLSGALHDELYPDDLLWRAVHRTRGGYERRGAPSGAVRVFVSPHEHEMDHGKRLAIAEFFAAVFKQRVPARKLDVEPMRRPPDPCFGKEQASGIETLRRYARRRAHAVWARRPQGSKEWSEGVRTLVRQGAAAADSKFSFKLLAFREAGSFDFETPMGTASLSFRPGRGVPILALGDARPAAQGSRPLARWRFPEDRKLARGVSEMLVAAQRGVFLGVPPAGMAAGVLARIARELGPKVEVFAEGEEGLLALYAALLAPQISRLEWKDAPCSFFDLKDGGPAYVLPGLYRFGDLPDICRALSAGQKLAADWRRK